MFFSHGLREWVPRCLAVREVDFFQAYLRFAFKALLCTGHLLLLVMCRWSTLSPPCPISNLGQFYGLLIWPLCIYLILFRLVIRNGACLCYVTQAKTLLSHMFHSWLKSKLILTPSATNIFSAASTGKLMVVVYVSP